ncbi:hypothetical protein [Xanthocytophaga agilis]|uniref:Beta-xylosidase C-terminal Concanavalin A-like domain-containing protein n=1 Tax=Xanthocytophaga agilis TaxID=3048010 RepID=A0AAE3R5T0_9BACT|nr:hypothetical protein [Xanthocytophaga agilis]MDJ1504386.1 hypothetical protein [Xanthocytophaga agilis]
MSPSEEKAFCKLFGDAYNKCFDKELTVPLSEADSRYFSSEIEEQTGLIIGWKTLKNYSFFILKDSTAKQENPSVATLDTLARYITAAPKTDEVNRKRNESHFPYWYAYRDEILKRISVKEEIKDSTSSITAANRNSGKILWGIGILVIMIALACFYIFSQVSKSEKFTENFNSTSIDSLLHKGWILKNIDTIFWNKRNPKNGYLTLFTLEGDTYPDSARRLGVKNLLVKKLDVDCFSTEIHLDNFVPGQNWQQAGIILMEDTTLLSRSARLTIGYNGFFGGYSRPGEVLIQAISSIHGGFSKPEEIAHVSLFSVEPTQSTIIKNNLQRSALRIEKNGRHFRFLYATGASDIFAFKEVVSRDLMINPRYVGICALKGFVKETQAMPVYVDLFSIEPILCE